MAPPVPKQLAVRLQENEKVALCLLRKWRSLVEGDLSEHHGFTFSRAYAGVCAAKEPIRTLDDLYKIKGVGKWIIQQIKGSFPVSSPDLSLPTPKSSTAGEKGKKTRGPKDYVPEEYSAAYAILITLYRETISGKRYMMKPELIDATEASGLSRCSIGPDKSKGKPGAYQHSKKDFYTGWSCMKTLTSKALVAKSGNPVKFMITEEGKATARDCLSRSGLEDHAGPSMITSAPHTSVARHNPELVCSNPTTKPSPEVIHLTSQENPSYNSKVQTANDFARQIILSDSDSEESYEGNNPLIDSEEFTEWSSPQILKATSSSKGSNPNFGASNSSVSIPPLSSSAMGAAGFYMPGKDAVSMCKSILAMPPRHCNENFHEAYEVVFLLDDREKFGPRSKKVAENIHSQFRLPVEMRRLPVGDGIWIARHRKLRTEYVLDFIVERKNVSDLCSSFKDNRYKDQKLRMKKCGLRKLLYLVEGDPNPLDESESIKTACFTTEILEGFDVLRTTGYADTARTYGHLTRSIIEYYSTNFSIGSYTSRVCPTYAVFGSKCCDLEKTTVSDVFALQLKQVPHVTEEAAFAVIELYPTLFSLAQAYSMLDGDNSTHAQEEMLKNKSELINSVASRNIFNLVWGEGDKSS